MSKTRGSAGAARTEAPREVDPQPRPGVNDASAATDDAIAQRAYELYQARGGTHGADMDDWLRAERELRGGREFSDGPSDEPDSAAHWPDHRPTD